MAENKHSYDPWHKELVWIHTRQGFISILFLNIASFALFNFQQSIKTIVYHDILRYERKTFLNRAALVNSTLFENCTLAGIENCKNVTAYLRAAEMYDLLEFRARVYDFLVYTVFTTVSFWLLATVYRTSYEKIYYSALVHNSLISFDLMESIKECKSDFLKSNPRSSRAVHRFVSREEYGLHTFLRDDMVFGNSREFDELRESLEDVVLNQYPLPGSDPFYRFMHAVEWIHDLLRTVRLMHKEKLYHLDLQPKKIHLHWLQSTVKTEYQAWIADSSNRSCIKAALRTLVEFDKDEYSDKRHVVLGKFDHAVRSENGKVEAGAVGVQECYRPPECFNLGIVDAAKVDAWCIGVIAYELLTGGMLTVRASRYPPNTSCEEILSETLNKEFISTAMNAHHRFLMCFLDIRFVQKRFRNYDLDQTVFATDCWTFVTGLLKSRPDERLSIQEALKHPLMKKVRRQTGKVYYINYPL